MGRIMKRSKEFDLNIENILENWEVYHAIREIIANALDEQILTDSRDVEIYEDEEEWWHIRDYGRGINYHHLTQNENEEKLKHSKLIGKFGVGLKDALATMYRHDIDVNIKSKYGIIRLKTAYKADFGDIETLHAEIFPAEDIHMVGTDFCIKGCTNEDIELAKSLFVKFRKENILEINKFGEIIEKKGETSSIFINGVKVAEEPNFLFSYNITLLNGKIKKALNRERTNVGRSAYSDRIKDILLSTKEELVIQELINDIKHFDNGKKHDEVLWNDIIMFVSKKAQALNSDIAFITTEQLKDENNIIDSMTNDEYDMIILPEKIIKKMNDINESIEDGNKYITIDQYKINEYKKLDPLEVDINKLTADEKRIYDKTSEILQLIDGKPIEVESICIAEKIFEYEKNDYTLGLWQPENKTIYILRENLKSISKYAGVLIHECVHAMTETSDVTREFENNLTVVIGYIVEQFFKDNN